MVLEILFKKQIISIYFILCHDSWIPTICAMIFCGDSDCFYVCFKNYFLTQKYYVKIGWCVIESINHLSRMEAARSIEASITIVKIGWRFWNTIPQNLRHNAHGWAKENQFDGFSWIIKERLSPSVTFLNKISG